MCLGSLTPSQSRGRRGGTVGSSAQGSAHAFKLVRRPLRFAALLARRQRHRAARARRRLRGAGSRLAATPAPPPEAPRPPTSATCPPGPSAATRSGSGSCAAPTPPEDGYITHMETDVVDDVTGEPGADLAADAPPHRLHERRTTRTPPAPARATSGSVERRTSATPSPRSASTPRARSGRRCRCPRATATETKANDRLGRRRDGDEPPLEPRSRLHPLRGDGRQQSADAGHALLVRRP